jgi:hypothetical protein
VFGSKRSMVAGVKKVVVSEMRRFRMFKDFDTNVARMDDPTLEKLFSLSLGIICFEEDRK